MRTQVGKVSRSNLRYNVNYDNMGTKYRVDELDGAKDQATKGTEPTSRGLEGGSVLLISAIFASVYNFHDFMM